MSPRTSRLTVHYQSGDDMLTNSVRVFRYFYWLLRKSLSKLNNRKFSDCHYSMGRQGKHISIFASHSFAVFAPHWSGCQRSLAANQWNAALKPQRATLKFLGNKCAMFTFTVDLIVFSQASKRARILNPRIWLANHALVTGPAFH